MQNFIIKIIIMTHDLVTEFRKKKNLKLLWEWMNEHVELNGFVSFYLHYYIIIFFRIWHHFKVPHLDWGGVEEEGEGKEEWK